MFDHLNDKLYSLLYFFDIFFVVQGPIKHNNRGQTMFPSQKNILLAGFRNHLSLFSFMQHVSRSESSFSRKQFSFQNIFFTSTTVKTLPFMAELSVGELTAELSKPRFLRAKRLCLSRGLTNAVRFHFFGIIFHSITDYDLFKVPE